MKAVRIIRVKVIYIATSTFLIVRGTMFPHQNIHI
jgi:hypothetical protein